MVFLTSLDNQNLLRALEILVVALIWLFFFRVIRAVWVEVRPPGPGRRGGLERARWRSTPSAEGRRAGRLHLRALEPPEREGQTFELGEEVTLGRAAGCGVRVEDAYTSSIHARLYRRNGIAVGGGPWFDQRDLGQRRAHRVAAKLGKGDLLQVGGTVFEVSR